MLKARPKPRTSLRGTTANHRHEDINRDISQKNAL